MTRRAPEVAGGDEVVTCNRLTGERTRLTVLQCARYWGAANGLATGGSAQVQERCQDCPRGRERVVELALPEARQETMSAVQTRVWRQRKRRAASDG